MRPARAEPRGRVACLPGERSDVRDLIVVPVEGGSGVGDGGQVGEQVRWFGWLERVGIAQRVKARWDRG